MKVDVKVVGLPEARRALAQIVDATRAKCKQAVYQAGTSMQKTAKAIVPFATGHLQGGIDLRFSDDGLTAEVSPIAAYARWVEGYESGYSFGRRPGGMPPAAPILAWIRVRGLPESALFPIRRKIALKGTPAHPFMRPAFDAEQGRFQAAMNRVLGDAAKSVESLKGSLT
jgi:hypothetical protein